MPRVVPPLRHLALVAILVGAFGALTAPAPARALNDSLYAQQWGLQKIGAPTAWNAGLLGEGVDIAVIDSGLHLTHQEFAGRVSAGRNWVSPTKAPQDDQCDDGADDADPTTCQSGGHGTHVAGIAAAAIDNGGSVGVAPRARLMIAKVLDARGSGTFAHAAEAVRWATDNGAEVINLSLGSDLQGLTGTPRVLNDAVRYAWSKGAICVFAAGNSFVLDSGFADVPALVVSATNRADQEPDFSSGVGEATWGLAAPGGGNTVQFEDNENILSTVWMADSRRDTYSEKRGTSMSAPFVAGAAAVLRGAGLGPQETVDRLLSTATDLGPRGKDSTFGSGRLDLAKAVQGLGGAAGPAPTTTPVTGGQTTGATAPRPSETPSTTSARRTTSPGSSSRTTAPSTATPTPAAGATTDSSVPTDATVLAPVVAADLPADLAPDTGADDDARASGPSPAREDDDGSWPLVVLAAALAAATTVQAARLVRRGGLGAVLRRG